MLGNEETDFLARAGIYLIKPEPSFPMTNQNIYKEPEVLQRR